MSQTKLETALEMANRKRLEALRVVHSSLDRWTWACAREDAPAEGLERALLLSNFIDACQHFAQHVAAERLALRRLIDSGMGPGTQGSGGETQ
jgi:hypothetical protein